MKTEDIEKQLKDNIPLLVQQLKKGADITIKTGKDGIKIFKSEVIKA